MRKLFGLPLNTGIVVVGAFSVVLFLYATIHTTYNLVQFLTQENPATPGWIIDPITGEISHGISLKTDDDAKGPKANYTGWIINTDTTVFHVLYVCLSAASLISAIFLIVAVARNKHRLLIPWLVVGTVGLIGLSLCIIYTIYLFIIYSINGWCVEATMIVVLVAAIIILVLQIYIWRGIQQFYMDLIDCNERRKILPTTVPLYAPDEAFY